MTKRDFTLHRERLLTLRARLQGDMSQMEDNALNKDHSQTTGMPTEMADIGSDNFERELTLDLMGGENRGEDAYAVSWRFGVNLLEEERLKLEVQPAFMRIAPDDRLQIAVGPSFAITSDLAIRAMYQFDKVYPGDELEDTRTDHRFILQLYFYRKM